MTSDPYAPIRAVTCAIRRGNRTLGTGVLIGPNLVATCGHVVSSLDTESIQAVLLSGPSGEIGAPARVLAVSRVELSDENLDLALLHLIASAPPDLIPIPLGWPAFAEPFLCWGFPELRDQEDEVPEAISSGLSRHGTVLSQVGTTQAPRLQLYSKLQIHPGLSGSPVVQTGPLRVVGLISSSLEPHDEGLAIPVSALAGAFPILPPFELLHPAPPSAHVVPRRIVTLGQTRAPSQTFVGRKDDLLALDSKLTVTGKVAVQAAITGLVGIGKTELALHYAHYHADPILFPGGVIWLDASTDLTGQWARLAPSLGISTGSVDPREIEPAVLSELASRDRLLLVLDNAESWKALQGHLPIGGTAHAFLATARERTFGGAQFGDPLGLGVLGDAEARELLRTTMGGRAAKHPEDIDRLLEGLGGHPLALEIAGTYLGRHPNVPAEELAQGARKILGKRDLDSIPYGKSFSGMMEELLSRLIRDEPDAARLFPLLGLFGEAPAPIRLLQGVWEAVGVGRFEDGFEALIDLHLADPIEKESWTTHRLVRAEARERLARETEVEERSRKALAIGLVGALQALDDFDFGGYVGFRAHVQAAADWSQSSSEIADLLQRARQFPFRLGDLPLALIWATQALETHELLLGNESTQVATDRSNLALILQDLGDLEGARREIEEALHIGRQILGDNHTEVAIFRSNLSAILKSLGHLKGARREIEEALRIDREALGDLHENVATRRSNLATILQDLGDLKGARREAEQALQIDRTLLGDDHTSVATNRSNLAAILQDQGNLRGAQKEAEEALRIDRKILGDNHWRVAIRRSNLAMILYDLGESGSARREIEEALRIDLTVRGEHHSAIATHRSNLSLVLHKLNDLKRAQQEIEKALQINRESLGDNHISVAICRSNLAAILQDLKELVGARREAREAVRIALLQPPGSTARERILANWREWLASQPASDA